MYPSSWLLAVAELLAFVVSSMVEECIENCEPMQAGEMAQMTGLGGWWFEVPVRGKLSCVPVALLGTLYNLSPLILKIILSGVLCLSSFHNVEIEAWKHTGTCPRSHDKEGWCWNMNPCSLALGSVPLLHTLTVFIDKHCSM